MKKVKNLVAAATLMAMVGFSTQSLNASECGSNTAGCGYEQCRTSPCLTPAIALGAIALVAIVAVAVQNSSHGGHGHCHN
jgi:hypothetical protein